MKKNKKSTEIQVGKEITDKAKKSDSFYTAPTESGRPIFYFRQPGDFVKGKLLGVDHTHHEFYSSKTYVIHAWEICQAGVTEMKADRGVEIIAYRDLRRIIMQCELIGSIVRIKMIGKLRTAGGHFRFVWEVYKDTGTFSAVETKQVPKSKRRKAKSYG